MHSAKPYFGEILKNRVVCFIVIYVFFKKSSKSWCSAPGAPLTTCVLKNAIRNGACHSWKPNFNNSYATLKLSCKSHIYSHLIFWPKARSGVWGRSPQCRLIYTVNRVSTINNTSQTLINLNSMCQTSIALT